MSASSSATKIRIVLMCLESDSNRHYAVFETALSTVGVPRRGESLTLKSDVGENVSVLSDKQGRRHLWHHQLCARALRSLIQEFQEASLQQSLRFHLF